MMSQRQTNNREALLDAAEALFSTQGFYLVTVRDITRKAGVRVAEVNDLFGSKEKLFYEVINRRATVINLMRCERLSRVDTTQSRDEQFCQIMAAFYEPLLAVSSDGEGWRNYLRLVPQMMRQKAPILVLVADFYTPVSNLFLSRIGKLYSNVSTQRLERFWHFALVTYFSIFTDDFRVGGPLEPAGGTLTEHYDKAFRDAESFVSAGFQSLFQSDN
jgi:AcrR family transcriptional regulator